MRAYIGDLDKKEVLKRVYEACYQKFKKSNPYLSFNDEQYELSDNQVEQFLKVNYVGYINGIYVNVQFVDDDLEFKESFTNVYLQTLYDMKLEKAIIYENPTNAQAFNVLREVNEEIDDIQNEIEEKTTTLSHLSCNVPLYKNPQSSVIKNNGYDLVIMECRSLWQDIRHLEVKITDLVIQKRNILANLVNGKTYAVRR